jgi:nucleotide-binding universal stress UspA family protein
MSDPAELPVIVADPMATDSRIVVGVDDSAHAASALRWALREAVVRNATLEVVHAWQPPVAALPFGAVLTSGDDAEMDAAAREKLNDVVDEAVGELQESRPDVAVPEVIRSVLPGAAAMTLIDSSAAADLLVVGSHGRTGLRQLVLGSVAHACVQHAACPVTVVRLP